MDFFIPDIDISVYKPVLAAIQVNAPFTHLMDGYQQPFIDIGLNPEIGLDAIALERFGDPDYREIARAYQTRNRSITLHGPFWDLSPGSPDEAIREVTRRRFEQLLSVVGLFRPRTVVCHPGYDRRRYISMREVWLERSIGFWSWLAGALSAAGTRLMLENVHEYDPEDLQPLVAALAPFGVGFCFDLGHQSAFGRVSLTHWLAVLGPFIGQLHLHDNDGTADQHLALGEGTIDFDSLWRWYAALAPRQRPVLTIEPHTADDFWGSLAYLKQNLPR